MVKTALIIINANIGSNPIRSLMSLDQTLNDTKVIMAEWSKAADSSSAIFGCAGSNPAGDIFFYIIFVPSDYK